MNEAARNAETTLRRCGAAAAMAVVLLCSCSNSTTPQVATLSSPTASGTAAGTVNSGDQAFVDYARCMRAHGVTDFPDPIQRAGHSGLSLTYPGNASTSVFQAADDQCKHFIAAIQALKENAAKNRVSPQSLQALTGYAHCMRDHQVPLLDPDPVDGHLSLGRVTGLSNDIGRKSPQFAAADTACRSLLPTGTPDDGTGPP